MGLYFPEILGPKNESEAIFFFFYSFCTVVLSVPTTPQQHMMGIGRSWAVEAIYSTENCNLLHIQRQVVIQTYRAGCVHFRKLDMTGL